MDQKAKVDDVIAELEKLIRHCQKNAAESGQPETRRFYEGMAAAYTTVALRLKGESDHIDPQVIDHVGAGAVKTGPISSAKPSYAETCSFCGRGRDEVGKLAVGPGVSICGECLIFGQEVIRSQAD